MTRGKNIHFYVLLVQHDPDTSYLVTKSLEENPSFPSVVDLASCIKEALAKLKKHRYNLLLVEADLNGEEGLSLIDEVRRQSLNLPFVM